MHVSLPRLIVEHAVKPRHALARDGYKFCVFFQNIPLFMLTKKL